MSDTLNQPGEILKFVLTILAWLISQTRFTYTTSLVVGQGYKKAKKATNPPMYNIDVSKSDFTDQVRRDLQLVLSILAELVSLITLAFPPSSVVGQGDKQGTARKNPSTYNIGVPK